MQLTKKDLESGHQTIHKYLINRSQRGDRKAQNELYKLYVDAMYNICRRMMGDSEEAKDVLQDAFIHAFTKLKTLQEERMFSGWLKRIVVNHCLNALKKRKDFAMSDDRIEDIPIENEESKTNLFDYQINKIMLALDKISVGCRTVLNLYVFEGYDHKEIAQILSISESGSKAQYSKAKSKIRQIIASQNN